MFSIQNMRIVNAYELASRRMFLLTKGKWARIQFNVWREIVFEPFPRQSNTVRFNEKQTCDANLFGHCSMPECWDDMVQCEGFKTASEDEWLRIVCGRGTERLEDVGRGDQGTRGLGDARGLGDVINKQHLNL